MDMEAVTFNLATMPGDEQTLATLRAYILDNLDTLEPTLLSLYRWAAWLLGNSLEAGIVPDMQDTVAEAYQMSLNKAAPDVDEVPQAIYEPDYTVGEGHKLRIDHPVFGNVTVDDRDHLLKIKNDLYIFKPAKGRDVMAVQSAVDVFASLMMRTIYKNFKKVTWEDLENLSAMDYLFLQGQFIAFNELA